jgi:hypothetical protein
MSPRLTILSLSTYPRPAFDFSCAPRLPRLTGTRGYHSERDIFSQIIHRIVIEDVDNKGKLRNLPELSATTSTPLDVHYLQSDDTTAIHKQNKSTLDPSHGSELQGIRAAISQPKLSALSMPYPRHIRVISVSYPWQDNSALPRDQT